MVAIQKALVLEYQVDPVRGPLEQSNGQGTMDSTFALASGNDPHLVRLERGV